MPRRSSAGRRTGTVKSAGGGQGVPSGGAAAGMESAGARAGAVAAARDGPQHAFTAMPR
ncbi:hypothetical protein ACFYY1_32265 [Streptomyces sp. NPDC001890]|uniref:hypothetical protein n=1 Tax=Streptomyces sp. NPDC001890 TaxID=3364620 RepID=UPI003673772A